MSNFNSSVQQPVVALFHSKGIIPRAIQWQTRSRWNHASVILDGVVYESVEGRGVLRPELWVRRCEGLVYGADYFLLEPVDALSRRAVGNMKHWLAGEVGKPYDYLAVARFVTRRGEHWTGKHRWFCSEMVYAAFLAAGCSLLRETAPWEVSPGLLAKSPLLEEYQGG